MEILVAWIKRGITGDQRAEVRPVLPAHDEAGALGVGPNVVTGGRKGVAGALILAQHMVVGLGLEAAGGEELAEVFAKKLCRGALIGCGVKADPGKMHVVGHEGVSRASEVVSGAGVDEQFAESKVEVSVEPTGGSVAQGVRPEDKGRASIPSGFQARELAGNATLGGLHAELESGT